MESVNVKHNKEEKKIPNLRFPGFEVVWPAAKLEELCNRISDGIHATPGYDDAGEYSFVNGNNLVDGKIEIDDNTKRVSREEYVKHKRDLGDRTILMSINGTIGNLACYRNEKVILGKSACYINVTKQVEKAFIYNTLQLRSIKYFFNSELTGTTIKNLSLKTIKNTNVYIPSLPEQQKIASFLSAVDQKIQQLTRKKELLELYKKGVMQKIFPPVGGQAPEIRFRNENGNNFPDWEEKRLGELAEIRRGASPRPISDPKWFDPSSKIGWVRISDVTRSNKYLDKTEQYLSEEGIRKSRLVEKGNMIMSICATIGKSIYTNFKVCIHDGFVVFENLKANKEYLYYFLDKIQLSWYKYGQPGTQVNLNTNIVGNENIPYPSFPEQKRIAGFLSSIDEKIEFVKNNITQTQKFKKGLLQQMFV